MFTFEFDNRSIQPNIKCQPQIIRSVEREFAMLYIYKIGVKCVATTHAA